MYSLLNTLSEYASFYMSKDITSYTWHYLFLKSLKAFSVSVRDFCVTDSSLKFVLREHPRYILHFMAYLALPFLSLQLHYLFKVASILGREPFLKN